MLKRTLTAVANGLRDGYPLLAITGPRQSGKTTLALNTFRDLPYVNLESPIERAEADRDPAEFLARFEAGAILDEVQNVPHLLSELQARVDRDGRPGEWILTGSQQLPLAHGVTQSLAGRVAMIQLLPFSHAELRESPRCPRTLAEAVLRGGYPRLYDETLDLDPATWLDNYLATFVNRDVRQILDIRDRIAFDRFLHLCAAWSGQRLNTAELARGAEVDSKTIASWLGVLEACYVIHLLRPHHRNFGKRIVKQPKLYFVDSALACRLLRISDVAQLRADRNYGALVETWCVSEALKNRFHQGRRSDLWYWRSNDGIEVDLLIERARDLEPFEIKAGTTATPDATTGIAKLRELSTRDSTATVSAGTVIYGGDEPLSRRDCRFIPWNSIDEAMGKVA